MSIVKDISRAVLLRKKGQHTEALAILLDLLKASPIDTKLNYEIACTYDQQGLEVDAIPHYEQAIALGIDGEDRRGALLGLGSSYRCVEQYADAVRTFERGIAEFPSAHEFNVFLAMALHNLGDHRRALQLLLQHIADHTGDRGTAKFRRVIFHYAVHLDPSYDNE
ncbi:MAG: tetratricopeptide repeat protein [Pseudomonadota bacterium]